MNKEEIALIILKVTVDGQEAISIKIYKEGTTCRHGVGGLPEIGISAMSFFNNSVFFDTLIAKVPENLLEAPLNYEEETPNGYLEYVVAFYGDSKNGETGERAVWSKSTGIRAKLDHQSSFRDPILGFLDNFTMDAAELTNEWYFDVIMLSKYKMQSSTLPTETMIGQPKTEEEIHTHFSNYINMMLTSARNWNMADFSANKIYEREGKSYLGIIHDDRRSFRIDFIEMGNANEVNAPTAPEVDAEQKAETESNKKPWWKVW